MLDADLSRRERQILEAVYALGSAGAREVAARLGEPDALDSIRVTLIGLEKKGAVRHRVEGRRHIYAPTEARGKASAAALKRVTSTFFGGSPKRALVALLDLSEDSLAKEDLDELERWVKERNRRERGR